MKIRALIFGAIVGLALAVSPSCGQPSSGVDAGTGGSSGSTGGGTASTGGGTSSSGGGTASTGGGSSSTGGGSASTGGGTASTGGGTASTGGGTASTGGGTASTGGGTAIACTLAAQQCGTGSACMVDMVSMSGIHTSCFTGDCDIVRQNCTAANTQCDYASPTPNGTPVRSCVAAGTATRGQACGQVVRCASGLTCIGAQLTDGGSQFTCEKYCYVDTDCASTEFCGAPVTITGSAEIPLICTAKPAACDPLNQSTCSTNEGCYPTQQGNLCAPAGTTAPGAACSNANSCSAGGACITLQSPDGGRMQECLKMCNLDAGMPSCTNQTCNPTQGGFGVCL